MEQYYGIAEKPIFIGGLMKSGTSLLRVLLGQHSEIYSGFETHWFLNDVRINWSKPDSNRMKMLIEFFELSENEYEYICDIKSNDLGREFIDILFQYCAKKKNKKRWAEKTPDNLLYWETIIKQWPSAKFIHVTREFKDCYSSWKMKRGDSLKDFIDKVKSVYVDIDPMIGNMTNNYYEVDYVQLVTDTENTMKKIINFIECDWEPECATLNLSNTNKERNKVVEVTGKDSHTSISLTKPIFTDSVNQWKKYLTNQEVLEIENELSRQYEKFGNRWA